MSKNVSKLKFLLLFTFLIMSSVPLFAQIWTLKQCIDSAQIHNQNLQISRNNMEMGMEKEKEAKSNLIPKVKFSGDYKYFFDQPTQLMPQSAFGGPEGVFKDIQFGTPHSFNLGLQAALPLYNPQVYGAIKTTKVASELNQLQFKKTREEVYYNISNLYYNAQVLKHQLQFVEDNLQNTSKLLKTVELLYKQKLARHSDVEKIQLQKQRLLTQKKTVENNLLQVNNLLRFNIGIPLDRPFDVETDIQYQPEISYTHNIIVDLQLANTKKDLIVTELKTLKNSRIPSLSLYGGYSEVGFGYRGDPENFLNFYPSSLVGVQLSFPVFNGMVTKRKINQKKIELKNTEIQVSLLNRQNTMQIENARRQRNVALTTIQNTNSQIKLAQSVYDQTVLQQKEGVASLTDVLMAENALNEAQQNNIAAIINYLKADLELKKLTGNIESIKEK